MKMLLCVGTYSAGGPEDGIQLYLLDGERGKLRFLKTIPNRENPSFVAFTHDRKYAYVAQELPDVAAISAYRLSENGCDWSFMGRAVTPGCGMCHLAVSPNDRFLLASNFTSGNIASVEIGPDGKLGAVSDCVFLKESSVRTDWWQDQSRCHETVFTPDRECVVVANMGGDRLPIYLFDEATGTYRENPAQRELVADPGDGPRHHAFSADGRMLYSVSEISADVVAYRYCEDDHTFARAGKFSTVPDDFVGWRTASEIMVSKNGRYVYVSNRGFDAIARFTVRPDGLLQMPPKYFDSLGPETRMFCFAPEDQWIIIANQKANRVSVCAYDRETGDIGPVQDSVNVSLPAFVEAWTI